MPACVLVVGEAVGIVSRDDRLEGKIGQRLKTVKRERTRALRSSSANSKIGFVVTCCVFGVPSSKSRRRLVIDGLHAFLPLTGNAASGPRIRPFAESEHDRLEIPRVDRLRVEVEEILDRRASFRPYGDEGGPGAGRVAGQYEVPPERPSGRVERAPDGSTDRWERSRDPREVARRSSRSESEEPTLVRVARHVRRGRARRLR